jgi:ribosomal protein S18 acetylase RimI-like enzyme
MMPGCGNLQISHSKSDEESAYVRQRLIEYNVAHVDAEINNVYEPINLIIRNDAGRIVGGLLAVRYWDCMHIDILWVDDEFRGIGYGCRLLLHIEEIAVRKRCRFIELDTFSFQAPEFYKKYGYQVIGTVEDIHGGHNRYYFIKRVKQTDPLVVSSTEDT